MSMPWDEDIMSQDRSSWMPPPSQDWQDAHGWKDGKPPPNGKDHAGFVELAVGFPAENEADIPQRAYVVPGYIPRGVVTELIGPGSAGKSQLTIAWGVATALGRRFGSFTPDRPMRVALFNVEDDIPEQQRRIAAALRMFGAKASDLGGRLRLLSPTGIGMLLTLDPETRRLMHTPLMDELVTMLDGFKPDLVVLDPLIELHDAQENDNTALRRIVAELRIVARTRDIGLLLLHHTPKGEPRPGNQDAGRGASAVGGVVRKSFTLFEMTEAEAAAWQLPRPAAYFRLDGAKANHDAKNGTEWFERVLIDLDNGEVTAAARPWDPPSETIMDDRITDLLALVANGDRGQPWAKQLGNYDRSFAKALSGIGIGSKRAQATALEALFAAGCVEAGWKRKNRAKAMGLRHPDGRPAVDWIE